MSGYVTCNNCGHLHSEKDNFCEACGAVLTSCDPAEVDELNGGQT